jgi:hypothetical protein
MTEIAVDSSVTTGLIAGSTKVFVDGVPFRRVSLSNGEITAEMAFIAAREGVVPRAGALRRTVEGAVRVSLARPVRAVIGSRHRKRISRCDPARRAGQDRALLLDVRAEVLLDAHHPRHPRRNGRKV